MPRGGWIRARDIFCGKFHVNISVEEFKKRAMNALTTVSGRKCSIREFKTESTKRHKPIEVLFEEKNLHEAKIYADVRKVYANCIARLKDIKVEKAEYTRKIPSEKVDPIKLEAVCQAVMEYSSAHPPRAMSDIARTIKAAQQCYQEVTMRKISPSTWKANIQSKIDKYNIQVELLEKAKNFEKLSEEEKKSIKKFMREFQQIINYLLNWKAAGPDGIYNYFIKKCDSLHQALYDIIKGICIEGKTEES